MLVLKKAPVGDFEVLYKWVNDLVLSLFTLAKQVLNIIRCIVLHAHQKPAILNTGYGHLLFNVISFRIFIWLYWKLRELSQMGETLIFLFFLTSKRG